MTKSKENLPKLVTGKVRATRNPFPQYVTAEADAGGFLEWKTKKAWVMRDSIMDSKMKFLPQIQAAQQEEGQEETSQHQGEEEALPVPMAAQQDEEEQEEARQHQGEEEAQRMVKA